MTSRGKKLLIILIPVLITIDTCASEDAYTEARGLIDAFLNVTYGGRNNKFSISEDDEDIIFFTCDAIHIIVETSSYNFIDDMLSYVNRSIGQHGLNNLFEKYYVNTIFDFDVRHFYGPTPYVRNNCISMDPIGSYNIEIVAKKEPSINSLFIFEKNGLKFSSDKFINPLYEQIKSWYTSDACTDFVTFPFVQWNFNILCGKVVSAQLYLEYSTGDFTVWDIINGRVIKKDEYCKINAYNMNSFMFTPYFAF